MPFGVNPVNLCPECAVVRDNSAIRSA
jgi:hypothetical protein